MHEGSVSRRGFLAAVGAGALAGCSTLESVSSGGDEEISTYGLPDIDTEADERPDSPVAQSLPVDIASDHLDSARERTTTLLSALPTSLRADDIPNGHVRSHLANAAGDARTNLTEALRAPTDLVSLELLRRARERARYAAAGWAVVEEGRTVAEMRQQHQQVSSEALSARQNHAYVGTDPVRAVRVHAWIEEALEFAADGGHVHSNHGGTLLTVAEWGEETEAARARLENVRHVDTQFTATLPEDAGTLDERFRDARSTLATTLRERQDDLPQEPTADEWGPREELVEDLLWRLEDGAEPVLETTGPASGVVAGAAALTRLGALDRVQQRIDSGEQFTVESAEDVTEYRDTAYDALRTALSQSPATPLARTVLTDAAGHVVSADWELGRMEGRVRASQFEDPIVGYVIATAMARATPDAVGRTVDVLRSG